MFRIILVLVLLLTISYAQACDCSEITENFSHESCFCEKCNGNGYMFDFAEVSGQCRDCKGSGKGSHTNSCIRCNGTGYAHTCTYCFGTGLARTICKCGNFQVKCWSHFELQAPIIVQRLVKYLELEPEKYLEKDGFFILNALTGLTMIAKKAERAIPSVINILIHQVKKQEKNEYCNIYIQIICIKFLQKVGNPAIPYIIDLLFKDSITLRRVGMLLLFHLKENAVTAIPYVKRFLNDPDEITRELAQQILEEIGKEQNSEK